MTLKRNEDQTLAPDAELLQKMEQQRSRRCARIGCSNFGPDGTLDEEQRIRAGLKTIAVVPVTNAGLIHAEFRDGELCHTYCQREELEVREAEPDSYWRGPLGQELEEMATQHVISQYTLSAHGWGHMGSVDLCIDTELEAAEECPFCKQGQTLDEVITGRPRE